MAIIINGDNLSNILTAGSNVDYWIYGNGGNDTLNGSGGNDILDGGTGNDSMSGGLGNDTYVVDSTGDIVNEFGGGTDLVQSSVSFSLATHAFAKILRRFMENMWQDLLLPSAGNPWLFEIYTRFLIASKSTIFKCRSGVGKRDSGRGSTQKISLGGWWATSLRLQRSDRW